MQFVDTEWLMSVKVLISRRNFELIKMDSVIVGITQYREKKVQTVTWLKELSSESQSN